MSTINLLPYRERLLEQSKRRFWVALVLLLGLCLGGAAAYYASVAWQIERQQQRNQWLRDQVHTLEQRIQAAQALDAALHSLQEQRAALLQIRAQRAQTLVLWNELAEQVPAGVSVRTLKREGAQVAINASADTQERVTQWVRQLTAQPTRLSQPELLEIAQAPASGGTGQGVHFVLRLTLSASKGP